MNAIRTGPDLGRLAMPLVDLLLSDDLSWSNKEKITDAIRHLIRVHGDMKKEAAHISGALCGHAGQAPIGPAFGLRQG